MDRCKTKMYARRFVSITAVAAGGLSAVLLKSDFDRIILPRIKTPRRSLQHMPRIKPPWRRLVLSFRPSASDDGTVVRVARELWVVSTAARTSTNSTKGRFGIEKATLNFN